MLRLSAPCLRESLIKPNLLKGTAFSPVRKGRKMNAALGRGGTVH